LPADGIVGQASLSVARAHGFGATTSKQDDWPPRPAFAPITTNLRRAELFGRFTYRPAPQPGNPEAIEITDGWDRENIVTVELPQVTRLVGGPANGRVPFHRRGAQQLQELFRAWETDGLLSLLRTWDGSWAPRFVRGSRTSLSNHAYGTAFDVNAQW